MAESEGETIRKLRHDLANPLAAILAETQLLLLSEASLDAETVEGLREIEQLARRMREMLASMKSPG
jgi:signal transduction histidine kinase